MADTKQNQRMKPQAATAAAHPEEYRHDLNPNAMAGQNIGTAGLHPEKSARTARDVKELHARSVIGRMMISDRSLWCPKAPGSSRMPRISI